MLKQSDLAIASCGKIAVSALGWNRTVLLAVPDQQRFAEPCARRYQPCMPACIRVAGMQREDALRRKLGDAVPVRFEVVDQKNMLDPKRLDQITRIQCPGQVRQLQATIADRPGNTEARCKDPVPFIIADG